MIGSKSQNILQQINLTLLLFATVFSQMTFSPSNSAPLDVGRPDFEIHSDQTLASQTSFDHRNWPRRDIEAHLPFQLHWSLEYWHREIRQRSSSGNRGANVGVSMLTSPLTSPPPGWNSDEVRRPGSSYVMFPCAPRVRSALLSGTFWSILSWARWVRASVRRSSTRRCWQLSVKGKLKRSGSDSCPAEGRRATSHPSHGSVMRSGTPGKLSNRSFPF